MNQQLASVSLQPITSVAKAGSTSSLAELILLKNLSPKTRQRESICSRRMATEHNYLKTFLLLVLFFFSLHGACILHFSQLVACASSWCQ